MELKIRKESSILAIPKKAKKAEKSKKQKETKTRRGVLPGRWRHCGKKFEKIPIFQLKMG